MKQLSQREWAKVLVDAHQGLQSGYDRESFIPYWALGCADAVIAKLAELEAEAGEKPAASE